MAIKSDKWIKDMAKNQGMIEDAYYPSTSPADSATDDANSPLGQVNDFPSEYSS